MPATGRVRAGRAGVTTGAPVDGRRARVGRLRAGITALLLAAAAGSLPADAVWNRAVELAKAAEHFVPGTMATRTEEYSADGKLRSTRETVMRARIVDGELTYEFARDVQNGEEMQPTQADAMTGASSMQFSDGLQVDLSAMKEAERDGGRTIRGQPAIGYRIEIPEEQYTIRGQMWVSEDGVPLELLYTVDPLPRTVRGIAISAYYEQQDGLAFVTEVTVQVAISIPIVFRRLYAITIELDNYFDPDA